MNIEVSSDRQIISMMTMFILGSVLILGVGSAAKQDAWISILISMVLSVPVMAMYARIVTLYPGKHFFEIIDEILGPILGGILTFCFSSYAFILAAMVTRVFSQFLKIVAFPETPEMVQLIMMGLVIIYSTKQGIEVLGRWSQFMVFFLVTIIATVSLLSLINMNMDNIRPVLYNGLKPVMYVAFNHFFFPFGETVIFLFAVVFVQGRNKPYRTFYYALAIGGFFITLVTLRNIVVLGPELLEILYFASYEIIGFIEIGKFFQRIEASVSIIFFLAGFVKTAVCMLAALKGIRHVFRLEHYRPIAAPMGLLLAVTCNLVFRDIMEIVDFANNYYVYLAFPFQIIIPVMIWIGAEIKTRKMKNQANPPAPNP